ncbi:uncharacterized protein LOC111601433 [Drosophila hydei]|uniref:Uncharacterized protein LOC111601433 n=1 Tax=Drosophila hydei TaxID=7224 RepID=A0A6J1M3Z2_DROHY|nr:uncharacterized protein LOC111601433 [Drosophila hydei]
MKQMCKCTTKPINYAFKTMAPNGCAAQNIPVMDPITNEFSTFNYTRGETSIVGNVSNIRISGLSNFIILNGEMDPNTFQVNFDFLFPELQILGSTIMEGVFNMFGFSFPMNQNMLLNERLEQLRIVGEYTFAQSLINSNGLRLKDVKLNFYVGEVKIENWDSLWNISANNFYDGLSSQMLAFLAKEIQPSMDQIVAEYVVPPMNNMLSNFSMTQITSFFVNTAKSWTSENCNASA